MLNIYLETYSVLKEISCVKGNFTIPNHVRGQNISLLSNASCLILNHPSKLWDPNFLFWSGGWTYILHPY